MGLPLVEEEHAEEARSKEGSVEASGVRMCLFAEGEGFLGEAFGLIGEEEGCEKGAFESAASSGLFSGVFPDLSCDGGEIGQVGLLFAFGIKKDGGIGFCGRCMLFVGSVKSFDNALGLGSDEEGLIAVGVEEELLSMCFIEGMALEKRFGEREKVAQIGAHGRESEMGGRVFEIVEGEGSFEECLSDGVAGDHADQSARDTILSIQVWASRKR